MRFFRGSVRERSVTSMLRHMEHGRYVEAHRALKHHKGEPLPPPHALLRLGRGLLEQGRPREAALPLAIMIELYPAHQDLPEAKLALARVHHAAGRPELARELAEQAERQGRTRDERRRPVRP